MTNFQIPPPEQWEKFEQLCHSLWSVVWKDRDASLHGRKGQKQFGVDVYGSPYGGKEIHGVQCKTKDFIHTDGKVTPSELREEVNKAKNFKPPLSHFILAYTGPSDTVLQEEERKINQEHEVQGLFKVKVMSWTEIKNLLCKNPLVFKEHYKELFQIFKDDTTDPTEFLKIHLKELMLELKKLKFNDVLADIHQFPVKGLELPSDIQQKLSPTYRIKFQKIASSIKQLELDPSVSWLEQKEARTYNLFRIKKQINEFIDELSIL
ncbi:hypothetical protein [Mesobacillus jeotgali]|uniref:Restriction endonuclease type IV Mrr domain-containing protein n=1 Tax=Mesobacillus jeotgali TaxID=129985 RepID=A0ABY9VBN8_9BACI|nr:hypothetical protein [Mesobacillus jeotgali]WNF21313.1 hypothetical protein RH061_14025 [Mesobacillus jeotgali]